MDISLDIKNLDNKLFNILKADNEITENLNDFIKGPSKRIRSKLCILYLKSNNCEITDDIINLLTAGELIHNSSLFHDDVIDDAEFRRENLTLARKFDSKISVLSGDYLLVMAVKLLIKLKKDEILNIFLNSTEKMCKAEINQYLLRGKIPSEREYIDICEGKTASLFAAILKCAAKIKGLDENKAENFGKLFGLVFQIQNDLSEESRKVDKKNGIYTAIDVLGIEKTNSLKDNCKEMMRAISEEFPNKEYCSDLNDLAVSI